MSDPVNEAFGASQALGELNLVESAPRFAEAMVPATLAVVTDFPFDNSAAFDSVHPATMARRLVRVSLDKDEEQAQAGALDGHPHVGFGTSTR